MNYPKDETGKVLFEMQKAGIDLTVSHNIVFFHLFDSQDQADAMAAHLAEMSPDITCNAHIDENPKFWHLDCSINTIPAYDVIIAFNIFKNILVYTLIASMMRKFHIVELNRVSSIFFN